MNKTFSLTASGHFVVGCNYWASHAGTAMWSDWRPRVVEADFKKLADAGLQVLRVFPLWSDFQPIHLLRGFAGTPVEFRFGERPLPDDEAGQAGVSAEMIERFDLFTQLARKYDLRLIVGLVTGWMSGRLFVPPALEGLNVLTDPLAIRWQVRFVKYFVRRLAGCQAIAAWDLGNECNCMDAVTRDQAWAWTHAITAAIRAADPTRPVVSGMHGLMSGAWTATDQGELTDLLTTHPYPIFTPGCDQDPINTIRTCLHATAESRAYADIGAKPCLAEEVGTLGPQVASPAVAADYIRTQLFSLWANDCRGLLWWCGFEQSHLEHAPYDWCAIERELGLFDADGKGKPVLGELSAFRRLLDRMPFDALPPRMTDGVCILSADQDRWLVAHNSFILAKQAGLEIEFQQEDQPLREAGVYLLPCVTGSNVISRRRWLALLEKVHAGATLYVSHNGGMVSPFNGPLGIQCRTRHRRTAPVPVTLETPGGNCTLAAGGTFALTIKPAGAEVLAREADGNPAFTVHRHGKGRIFFLSFPVELQLAAAPGAYHHADAEPYWQIYRHLAAHGNGARAVAKNSPAVGLTEHALPGGRRIVVAVNYSPAPVEETFTLKAPWKLAKTLHGSEPRQQGQTLRTTLPANDAVMFAISGATKRRPAG